MWQKTRSIVAYMYDNYLDDYDYFYLSGDDTHLIVENLRNYLDTLEDQGLNERPLFFGKLIPHGRIEAFVGGGGGYVLNRITLMLLVEKALPTCEADVETSEEDVYMSICLQNKLGIKPIDTADATGRQRFQSNANFLAKFNPDAGPLGKLAAWRARVYAFWAKKHGFKWGKDLVSTQSIAFHGLRSPVQMKRHHAILYKSCPRGTTLGEALAS